MKYTLPLFVLFAFMIQFQINIAQTNAVVAVPYDPNDLSVPFPAYCGARITLKAIFRSTDATGTYTVTWDENLNGDLSDDAPAGYSMTSNKFINIGRAILIPTVSETTLFNIPVQVHNNSTGMDYYGNYPVLVHNFTPSNDPREWTADQVEIMNEITKQEALWYLHRNLVPTGTPYTSLITGSLSEGYAIVMALNFFLDNVRYPAYPPGSMNAYGFTIPTDWTERNNTRWYSDPYAETALRLLNYLLNNLYEISGIPAGDEGVLCGYESNGNEITGSRITGTTDGKGLFNSIPTYYDNGVIANQGMILEAVSKTLPVFSGTPAQIGNTGVISKSFEYIVQQMVDVITFAQQDVSAPNSGGWYYSTGQGSYINADASNCDIWGLMAAEKYGSPCGVLVTNLVKYRLANYLINMQNTAGGVKRWSSYTYCNNFNYTASAISAGRWLGVDQFSTSDPTVAFPAYSTLTRAALRTAYNKYLTFVTDNWAMNISSDCVGYADGLWKDGDYLSGNTDGVYDIASNGNTFNMMNYGKSLPVPNPGIDSIGLHDWKREFAIYYQRAQKKNTADYSTFGLIKDTYCSNGYSQGCNAGIPSNTALGGMAISVNGQSLLPVAVLNGNQPVTITAGCAGSGFGEIIFDDSNSYSFYLSNTIATYQIDVDQSDGWWWETAGNPDFSSNDPLQTFPYTYINPGSYTATLRVIDQFGQSAITQIQITALPGNNVAPTADAGGPYATSQGQMLSLYGLGDDENIPCGDQITFDWDINNDGVYDILNNATPSLPWAMLSGYSLPLNTVNTITLRVKDSEDLFMLSTADLTIYQLNPVALFTYTPEDIYCNEEASFDASTSYHPNPDRSIVSCEWDFDNDNSFEISGVTVLHTFMTPDPYTVTLKVTDDNGRTNVTQTVISVSAGTNIMPSADAGGPYIISEEESLDLLGSGDDENIPCGDLITFDWDLDNDGIYDIFNEPTPTISWSTLSGFSLTLNTPNTITLKVTDSEGLFAESSTDLTIYQLNPVALFTYTPEDIYCNEEASFDASTSYHPNPDRSIVSCEWDFNNDNSFETSGVTVLHTFMTPDPYTVTLKVTDDNGQTNVRQTVISVFAGTNIAPSADAGGPYIISEEESLDLLGSGDDENIPCGDLITFDWDLDNNGIYDILNEPTPTVSWSTLSGFSLTLNTPHTITLKVTDSDGLFAESSTNLTIYQLNPVAQFTYTPEDIYCNEEASFDASTSYHPNPFRSIVSYEWDFNNDDIFETSGMIVSNTFNSFGNNTIKMKVEDDLEYSDTITFMLEVLIINEPPVASTNTEVYEIHEGDDLILNASDSNDPNEDCGDFIVWYEWDIDNNGIFNDPIDKTGVNPTVSWSEMEGIFPYPSNYETGEPSQSVVLKVTDQFLLTNTDTTIVRIYSPVNITEDPIDVTADPGSDVEFSVSASGSEPFTYQWYRNDEPIANTNSSVLILTNITIEDEGAYACLVSNQETNAQSANANLIVNQSAIPAVLDDNGLLLYPNPTNGLLTIELQNKDHPSVIIELINTAGETVYIYSEENDEKAFKKDLTIDRLKKGIYFFKIRSGSLFAVKKIILY